MLKFRKKSNGKNSPPCETKPHHNYNLLKDPVIALKILFFAILIGAIFDFWQYGPYITPDTSGYFKMIQGNYEELGVLSPFYSFILSLFPFSHFTIFDRVLISGIAVFLLAFLFLYKTYKKMNPKNRCYLYALGCSLLSWWSFRILGRAHADSHFYILLLLWLYLFIWKRTDDIWKLLMISFLSGVMVWAKLNTLFLVPLLGVWIIISKEKQWLIVIGTIIISWIAYKMLLPENILDLHLSSQVVLQTPPTTPAIHFYENLSSWTQVTIGMIFSDVITQFLPLPAAFTLGCIGLALIVFYLIRFRKEFNDPIYKLLLISIMYSVFFLGFQQWIGYKEINFRTLFPHLLVLSIALWLFLIRNKKASLLLLIAFLITSHTLIGHFLMWQRDDVSSLITAERFHSSKEKEAIDGILNEDHRQIFTDAPEKIMLSFLDKEVLQIEPKAHFIEGKNYTLSEEETLFERQKAIDALLRGTAIVVLFHTEKPDIINRSPTIRSAGENGMSIFY